MVRTPLGLLGEEMELSYHLTGKPPQPSDARHGLYQGQAKGHPGRQGPPGEGQPLQDRQGYDAGATICGRTIAMFQIPMAVPIAPGGSTRQAIAQSATRKTPHPSPATSVAAIAPR